MTQVTIIGNLVADPELRFIPSGAAKATFAIAESSRVKENGEWKDGPATFWRCEIWNDAAENLAESLKRGMRVIAVGETHQRNYETKAGESRTVTEVKVSEIGPSLKWAMARPEKALRSTKPATAGRPAEDDPWGTNTSEAPF
jgi:single-strand DNA-binding protein